MLIHYCIVQPDLHSLPILFCISPRPIYLARANKIEAPHLACNLGQYIAHVRTIHRAAHTKSLERIKNLAIQIDPLLGVRSILMCFVESRIVLPSVHSYVELIRSHLPICDT